MIKFLLNANLSPLTAKYLRSLGYNTRSITEEDLGQLTDEEVVKLALKESRMVVTFDLDFGEIYNSEDFGKPGIVVFKNQRPNS